MDPDAVLDYAIDWTDWLATGDGISSATWTVTGATKTSELLSESTATVWLSSPTGDEITAACKVEALSGRTDERSLIIKVADR